MKKLAFFSIIFLFLFLVTSGVLWFFLRSSSRDITECLPSNTLFYATFPNLTKTALKYQSSDLKKIIESNEASALGSLLIAKLQEISKKHFSEEDIKLIDKIRSSLSSSIAGETFLAVTQIDIPNHKIDAIMGTRPIGTSGISTQCLQDIETFLDHQHIKFSKSQGETSHVKYVCYEEAHTKTKICLTSLSGWNVVSIGEENLQKFIEAYKKPGLKINSLASNADFRYVLSQYDVPQDFIMFCNIGESFKPFLDLIEKGSSLPRVPSASLTPDLKSPDFGKFKKMMDRYFSIYRGMAVGLRFNQAKLAERWVIAGRDSELLKKVFSIYEPTSLKSAKFTGFDTLLYLSGGLNLKNYWDYTTDIYRNMGISIDEAKSQIQQVLTPLGIDFDQNIIEALGGEYGFQVDWPKDSSIPNVSLYLEVKNVEKFKPTREFLEKTIPQVTAAMGGLTISEKNDSGTKLLSTSIPSFPYISPTLTFSDQFVTFQLLEKGALQNLHRNPSESVLTRDVLKKRLDEKHPPYIQVAYCDTPTLVDRSYAEFRNFGLTSPFITGLSPIPASKWPEKLTISQPLGQVFWISRIINQNTLIADTESGAGSQIVPLYIAVLGGATYWALEHPSTKTPTPSPISTP